MDRCHLLVNRPDRAEYDAGQLSHSFTVRFQTGSYLHRPLCDVLRQTCCACQQDAVVAAGAAILAVSSSCWRYGAGVVDVIALQLNLRCDSMREQRAVRGVQTPCMWCFCCMRQQLCSAAWMHTYVFFRCSTFQTDLLSGCSMHLKPRFVWYCYVMCSFTHLHAPELAAWVYG
jgi:hypothetical protein